MTDSIAGKSYAFCCPGCHHVFLVLSSGTGVLPEGYKGTDLFRACIQAGIVPDPGAPREDPPCPHDVMEPLPFKMRVEGMWCPSCAWLLTEILSRTRGLADVRTTFVTDTVEGTYLPHVITLEEIEGIVNRLGYSVTTENDGFSEDGRKLLLHVALSAILTAQVMMMSMGLDGGFFILFSPAEIRYLSVPILLLASPVVFWSGYSIIRKGVSGLFNGVPTMDTLVAVATLSAFAYSTVRLFQGGIHLYFDTAAMLVTFVLFGRLIETRLRQKVLADVRGLYELTRAKVRLIDGGERWVRPEEMEGGACFGVRSGETLPLDGRVRDGQALIDESILSGESRPVRKGPGDLVLGGSRVLSGELVLEKGRSGRESFVGQVLSLLEQTIASKGRQEVLADRVARFFVPAVLLVAAASSAALWAGGFSGQEVLLRGLTVLLIACPCALGLAMPLLKVAVVSAARRQGIIIREPDAIDLIWRLDVMVFDKTGTLTEGDYRLRGTVTDGALTESAALACLAALESHSSHLIAREIVRSAGARRLPKLQAEDCRSFEGLGVSGKVLDREISVGSSRFMRNRGLDLPLWLKDEAEDKEKQGMTTIFYGWSPAVRGFLFFGDSVRENAVAAVAALQSKGMAIWMVSGDSTGTTRAVAERLGVDRWVGEAVPAEKSALLRQCQKEGHRVGMVGDGVNDAPAIARADVGFAIASPSELVRKASDVTLLTSDPLVLDRVFRLSRRSSRAAFQNLSFAFMYNVCALPLATAGLLNPPLAVCLMFASSLTVTGNALRLFRTVPVASARGRTTGRFDDNDFKQEEGDAAPVRQAVSRGEP